MPETTETNKTPEEAKPKAKPKQKSGLEMRVDALEIEMAEWKRLYRLLLNDYQSRFSGVIIK